MKSALRTLFRVPGLTVACVITLGLGVGAATAVFGVAYGVLFRPLPFADPQALVQLTAITPGGRQSFSLAEFEDWQTRTTTLDGFASFLPTQVAFEQSGDTSPVPGAVVSARFFDSLGMPMALGRGLTPADDLTAAVVVSERLWRRRLAGDPGIIGQAIRLNHEVRTIVGVVARPAGYPAADTDIWLPVGFARRTAPPQWNMRGFRAFSVIARLRPGHSIASARTDAGRIAADLAREFPRFSRDVTVSVVPLREQVTAPVRPALQMLLGAAIVVLAAACANVAGLLLAHGPARQREIAIRLAIGARRSDIAGQLLAEAALLGAAGALTGLAVAALALGLVHRLDPVTLPRLEEVRIGLPVLLFVAAAAAVSTIACGAAMLAQFWTIAPGAALHLGRATQPRARRLNTSLILSQIAAAVVLLITAAVLARSVSALLTVPVGIRSSGVYAATVNMSGMSLQAPAQQTMVLERLIDVVAALPGIEGTAVISSLPPSGSQMRTSVAPAQPSPGGGTDVATEIVAVSAHAFDVLGVRIVAGRTFAASDDGAAPRVVILSEAAARRLFPGQDPVGRALPVGASSGGTGTPTVVGLASDVRYSGLDGVEYGAVYLPYAQRPFRTTSLIVRAPIEAAASTDTLRRAVSSLSAGVALSAVRPLDDVIADATAQPRLRATALVVLSALVLGLAAVGLYAVMAHAVSIRRDEFAIRMALGAAPRTILSVVIRRGLIVTGSGVAVGVAAGLAAVRLLSNLVFGVSPWDAVSFGIAATVTLLVGAAATLIPAMRAARIAPVTSLRSQ